MGQGAKAAVEYAFLGLGFQRLRAARASGYPISYACLKLSMSTPMKTGVFPPAVARVDG